MTYLELKQHAGPCRLGRLHIQNASIATPNFLSIAVPNLLFKHELYLIQEQLENIKIKPKIKKSVPKITLLSIFSKNHKKNNEFEDFGILPSFSVGYSVPRKLAMFGVEETIRIAKELDKDNKFGASVEGCKYVELAKKCIDEFRERPLLRISSGEKLQKEHRKLAEIVTYARESLSPNAVLYFPHAKPWMLYVLAYMGIDLFDNSSAIKSALSGVYLTKSREFLLHELKELPCECNVCRRKVNNRLEQKELAEHNFNVLSSVLKEIREHARKNLLRELVEERCTASTEAMGALRILDREKKQFLEKYTSAT